MKKKSRFKLARSLLILAKPCRKNGQALVLSKSARSANF
jgi:hypothetical protein